MGPRGVVFMGVRLIEYRILLAPNRKDKFEKKQIASFWLPDSNPTDPVVFACFRLM